MAPGVVFESKIASPTGASVQCTIHSTLHFKNSIAHPLVLSAAARGVVEVAARQRCFLVQRTIHNNLLCTNSINQSLACLDTAGPGVLSNL
jgi:hypothetical protein